MADFRRRLLEGAKDKVPESEINLLGDNFEFLQNVQGLPHFLPMPSFDSMFERMTDAFRDFSPHYDTHFDFLSNANERLEKPYPDVSLHIYVQNSMVNNDGEMVTEKFECADGFPNDLNASCKDMMEQQPAAPTTEEEQEAALETEIEEILEEAIQEAEEEVDPFGAEEELDTFEAEEGELGPAVEDVTADTTLEEDIEDPNFFDKLISFFSPVPDIQKAEEITERPETDAAGDFGAEAEEEMMMHDCGHMFGNDDELMNRQIPSFPFQGLFEALFDEPRQQRAELPKPSRDPFFDLFFPMKDFDQVDIQVPEWQRPNPSRVQYVFPMNSMRRMDVSPTTTTLEAQQLYSQTLEDDATSLVNDYTIETAIVATILFFFAFLGLRRACMKTTCEEQCGEPEITTETAKEMTQLPKDFHKQLIATEPLEEELDVENRLVAPKEVNKIVPGDGI